MAFCANDEVLRSTWSCSPRNEIFGDCWREVAVLTRFSNQLYGIFQHVIGYRNAANQFLVLRDLFTRNNLLQFDLRIRSGAANDRQLFDIRWVIDPDVEHETVELSFRQSIGSFLFDRVLRSEYEERMRKLVSCSCSRHTALLHRFKQSRLRFRRCTVDLI